MLQVKLDSAVRTVFGKGAMRQLRMKEITPANLYSGGNEAVPLQMDAALLYKHLLDIHGRNAVISLKIEGDTKGERHVLVQELQQEPVNGKLLHVDFIEIELDKPLQFTVPVQYVGTAKGVDLGGELHIVNEHIRLRGVPMDIPDVIQADITALERGGAGLTYSDLAVPANVEMLEQPDALCVAVR